MVSKMVEIVKDIFAPAAAAAFVRVLTGKTQGPVDYLTCELDAYVTENNTGALTETGLNNAVDYIKLSLNSSKSGAQGDEGKVLYTFYAGGVGAGSTDTALYTGTINEVMRMLWRMNMGQRGLGAITKNSARNIGVVYRLPLFKNEPVEISVEIGVLVATWFSATGVIVYTTVTTSIKAHMVDSCEDMKFAQTVKTGDIVASAENAAITIPDRPGYYLLGYVMEVYDLSDTHLDALFGACNNVDNINTSGWCQIRNSEGQVFDFATGPQMVTDITAIAGPHELYAAARLWDDGTTGLGSYARLMVSPIEAKNLQLILWPSADAAAGDRIRVTFFYVTQKQASKDTNRTQPQTTKTGSDGAISSN